MKDWKAENLLTRLWAFQINTDVSPASHDQSLVKKLLSRVTLGRPPENEGEVLNEGCCSPETSETRGRR